MKKSTRLIVGLFILLLSGMLATDMLLKQVYSNMNVSDPFKNYQDIAVKPFKAIRVTGGNTYAIQIRDGDSFNIKVMNSRKGFLKVANSGDTLSILFTVPENGKLQAIGGLPVGIIIYCPDLSYLQCNGTSVMLRDIQSHLLTIEQKRNACTDVTGTRADSLHIRAYEKSWIELGANNQIDKLVVNVSGDAGVSLKGARFKQFQPHLLQNGKLLFYESSINQLMK